MINKSRRTFASNPLWLWTTNSSQREAASHRKCAVGKGGHTHDFTVWRTDREKGKHKGEKLKKKRAGISNPGDIKKYLKRECF